jgi:hypothetical protein
MLITPLASEVATIGDINDQAWVELSRGVRLDDLVKLHISLNYALESAVFWTDFIHDGHTVNPADGGRDINSARRTN